MTITIALAGDAMLGRGVAARVATDGPHALVAGDVREVFASADLALVNLECCVSARGRPWEGPGKRFHFRAPPEAVDALDDLGVDCVTLANNHTLDFGYAGLSDTLAHLSQARISAVGAGADLAQARAPVLLEAGGLRVAVLGVTDHPADFAAGPGRPGVAYADLSSAVPRWLTDQIADLASANDAVIVLAHWGPSLTTAPLPAIRSAGRALVEAGATLVAGHSAHVCHGVAGRVLYDLGDFINDYPVDPAVRNDLGLLFLVALDGRQTFEVEAAPLKLEYGRTRLARGAEADWIGERFAAACSALGSAVRRRDGRLAVTAG